jgi:hypothetical protein
VEGEGARLEREVLRFAERDRVAAEEREAPGRRDVAHAPRDRVHVHALRRLAHEPEDDRPVGAVPAPRGAERAVEVDAHAPRAIEEPRGRDRLRERARRLHRPDGVRGGGPDADLEEVEDAGGHGPPPF